MRPAHRGDLLREEVEDIVNQLRPAGDGELDMRVRTAAADETTQKLEAATNAVLDAARRAVAEAEEENARLRQRNEELEQFAYVASHDLQEPLRMVISFLQLLQLRYEGQLDEKADEFIGYAVDGSMRMQRLIQDLLAFTRIGSRGQPPRPTDMEGVLEEVRQELAPALAEVGARLTHGPLPAVVGDRPQLVQLLQHLIGNAIKFRSDAPPEVRVSAREQGRFWRFEVSDNGIGIAEEHQERVFQIFQRLHTREEYEGTGIGLAICKRIVGRHGGDMGVESAPGGGATFWFTLPAVGEGEGEGEGGGQGGA